MNVAIAHLQASLDRLEQRQQSALASMEEDYLGRERRLRGVLRELGMDIAKRDAPSMRAAWAVHSSRRGPPKTPTASSNNCNESASHGFK